jgi:hypothetical protein
MGSAVACSNYPGVCKNGQSTVTLAPSVVAGLEIEPVHGGGLDYFENVSSADACRLKSAFNS